jgi:hypothetical protein
MIDVPSHVANGRVAENLHEHHFGVESLAYATARSDRRDGNAWHNVGYEHHPHSGG